MSAVLALLLTAVLPFVLGLLVGGRYLRVLRLVVRNAHARAGKLTAERDALQVRVEQLIEQRDVARQTVRTWKREEEQRISTAISRAVWRDRARPTESTEVTVTDDVFEKLADALARRLAPKVEATNPPPTPPHRGGAARASTEPRFSWSCYPH